MILIKTLPIMLTDEWRANLHTYSALILNISDNLLKTNWRQWYNLWNIDKIGSLATLISEKWCLLTYQMNSSKSLDENLWWVQETQQRIYYYKGQVGF